MRELVEEQGDVFLNGKAPYLINVFCVVKCLTKKVFQQLKDAVCRNRPKLEENQTWMLHTDNALSHTSLVTQ